MGHERGSHTGRGRGIHVGRGCWETSRTWTPGATQDMDVGAAWDMDAGATRDMDVGAAWDVDAGATRDMDAGRQAGRGL